MSVHRVASGDIVAAFNTTVHGSVFDRMLFRSGNWNGEKGGDTSLQVEVQKYRTKYDSPIMSGLLMLRKNDKGKPNPRIRNCRLHKHTSIVQFIGPSGEWRNVLSLGRFLNAL